MDNVCSNHLPSFLPLNFLLYALIHAEHVQGFYKKKIKNKDASIIKFLFSFVVPFFHNDKQKRQYFFENVTRC